MKNVSFNESDFDRFRCGRDYKTEGMRGNNRHKDISEESYLDWVIAETLHLHNRL